MMTDNRRYDGLARMLVLNVGGRDNVVSLSYRGDELVFVLHDEGNANSGILESLDGISGVTKGDGEYRIRVSSDAPVIYDCVLKAGSMEDCGLIETEATSAKKAERASKNWIVGPIVVVIVELLLTQLLKLDIITSSVVAVVVGCVCGILAVRLLSRTDNATDKERNRSHGSALLLDKIKQNEIIVSPVKGEAKPLRELSDEAFASEAIGKGVGFIPVEGKLYAPCDGTIATLFPTGHAIGIHSDKGTELLIHVGLDTVKMDGKGFTPHKSQGDHTKKGELLLEFNIDEIIEAGMSIETPMIISNSGDYKRISVMVQGQVEAGTPVIEVFADV